MVEVEASVSFSTSSMWTRAEYCSKVPCCVAQHCQYLNIGTGKTSCVFSEARCLYVQLPHTAVHPILTLLALLMNMSV